MGDSCSAVPTSRSAEICRLFTAARRNVVGTVTRMVVATVVVLVVKVLLDPKLASFLHNLSSRGLDSTATTFIEWSFEIAYLVYLAALAIHLRASWRHMIEARQLLSKRES
jgi:hypothetical protein